MAGRLVRGGVERLEADGVANMEMSPSRTRTVVYSDASRMDATLKHLGWILLSLSRANMLRPVVPLRHYSRVWGSRTKQERKGAHERVQVESIHV
jgi:hypothetical protein